MLDDDLALIVQDIAGTLFGAEPQLTPLSPAVFDAGALTARVALDGAFSGTLEATFSEGLARRLTGLMMDRSPAACSEAEVADAVGELANIAAGNLKAVLPEPCEISLPHVQAYERWSAERLAVRGVASFALYGEPLLLQLSARESA